MSCNCNNDQSIVTLDLNSILGRLTSESGVAAGSRELSAMGGGEFAYHHIDTQSWLTSSAVSTDNKEVRTLKGIIEGLEFDYDITLELKGSIVEATLIVRKPIEFSVTLEIDLKTGKWKIKPGTLSGDNELSIESGLGTLGCGKWCIVRCLGFGALRCILCGPVWPCWVACLKTSAPGVAVCIAKCCS